MTPTSDRSPAAWADELADERVGAVVVRVSLMRRLEELVGEDYARFRLSPRLEDLARRHGVGVWFRRE